MKLLDLKLDHDFDIPLGSSRIDIPLYVYVNANFNDTIKIICNQILDVKNNFNI